MSKTLGGLVYFAPYLYGGRSPPITEMQNTQASPEFLTLPQVIPTVGTSCLTILLVNTLSLAVCFPSLSPSLENKRHGAMNFLMN